MYLRSRRFKSIRKKQSNKKEYNTMKNEQADLE